MGPQDYQDAMDALNSPDAPPPVKAAAQRLVERYSGAMAKDQNAHRSPDLGEHSSLGPTGLDAMQAGGLPSEASADVTAQLEREHPGVARAFSMQPPIRQHDPAANATAHDQYDMSLQTMSKRKDMAAPPEWHPPTPIQPANPFDSVWGKIKQAANALPEWVPGGGTEHYIEPSIEKFRQEMAPVLGDKVALANEDSDLYKEYADAKYLAALKAAQTEGRDIVRHAFRKGDIIDAIPGGVTRGLHSVLGASVGADKGLTGGLLSRATIGKERADEASRDTPYADMAGFVAGAANPNSVGNLAVKGAAKGAALLPGGAALARVAGSLPGRIAAGAPAGYIGAAATDLAGEAPDVLSGDEELSGALSRANSAGLSGSALGLVGGFLGAGMRAEARNLRDPKNGLPLASAEAGGARMRPFRGVDPGEANLALEARARSMPGAEPYAPNVPEMLAGDLREPFANRARELDEGLKARGGTLREFEQAYGHEKIPLKNTVKAILDARKKLVQSDGTVIDPDRMTKLDDLLEKVLSFHGQPPEGALTPKNPALLDQLDNAIDVHGALGTPETFSRDVREMQTPTRPITPTAKAPTPNTPTADVGPFTDELPDFTGGVEAGAAGERLRSLHEARGQNPHTFDITPEQAREHALPVGQDEFARLSPKPKNPEDMRQIVETVRGRHEKGSLTKEPFPDYEKIKRALHQDRDAFKGETGAIKQSDTFTLENGETVRGYSAANASLEKDISSLDNFLDLLGLKKMPGADDTSQFAQLESRARGYGKGGRSPEIDKALREMAEQTGMAPTLENLKRYRAMRELKEGSRLTDAMKPWSHPTATRLRLDPILQAMRPGVEGAGNLGALPNERSDLSQLPPKADDATLEEIRRALAP